MDVVKQGEQGNCRNGTLGEPGEKPIPRLVFSVIGDFAPLEHMHLIPTVCFECVYKEVAIET